MDISMYPVGKSKIVNEIDEFISKAKQEWQSLKPTLKSSWKILSFAEKEVVAIAKYLLFSTDMIIVLVEKSIPGVTGADKKATVLAAIATIYDFVTIGALPKILLPWRSSIKLFVIYVLISGIIDYTVDKYNEGVWSANQGG